MMKNLVFVMAALIAAMSVFAYKKDPEYLNARRNGGELRMIVSAIDDDGSAVSKASVKVLMGMTFRERAYYINGVTDVNGQFIVEGKTTGKGLRADACAPFGFGFAESPLRFASVHSRFA